MNRGDLKANPGDVAGMARAESDTDAFALISSPSDPRPRRRGAAIAFALSVLVHLSLVTVLALTPRGIGSLISGTSIVDTRVPVSSLAIDGFVTFPADEPVSLPKFAQSIIREVEMPKSSPTVPKPESGPIPETSSSAASETKPAIKKQNHDGDGSRTVSPGGKGASFFQIPIRARRVVFVVDRSASMGLDHKLNTAKEELLACLAQLPANMEVQVIAYNRLAEPLRLAAGFGPALATAEVQSQIERALADIHAEGGTNHLGALNRALLLWPDEIVFLTDADDLTEEQVREVSRVNGGRAVIHTVEMFAGAIGGGMSALHELANANHGRYMAVTADTSARLTTNQR